MVFSEAVRPCVETLSITAVGAPANRQQPSGGVCMGWIPHAPQFFPALPCSLMLVSRNKGRSWGWGGGEKAYKTGQADRQPSLPGKQDGRTSNAWL